MSSYQLAQLNIAELKFPFDIEPKAKYDKIEQSPRSRT